MKSNLIWFSIFLLLIIACCFMWWYRNKATEDYTVARILQNGVVIKEIDLSKVKEPYEFVVEDSDGKSNTISVEQGRIAVTDASCRDKICVNTGYISTGAAPIVCLPNRLSITIVEAESNIDAVSGNN